MFICLALAVLADFSAISRGSLQLVMTHQKGALLHAWLALLSSSKPELSSSALAALVKLFDQTDEQFVDNESSSRSSVFGLPDEAIRSEALQDVLNSKKAIFGLIGEARRVRASHYLITAAKQPIASLRNAAMNLMRAIAAQRSGWGLLALFDATSVSTSSSSTLMQSPFWKYLTERTTESSKEGKDYKFALISAVAHHPANDLLSEEITTILHQMLKQGPYYMPAKVEVETI